MVTLASIHGNCAILKTPKRNVVLQPCLPPQPPPHTDTRTLRHSDTHIPSHTHAGKVDDVPSQRGSSPAVDRGCMERLRHAFIRCSGSVAGNPMHDCIVDPLLGEQFQIGNPAPAFDVLLRVGGLGSSVTVRIRV